MNNQAPEQQAQMQVMRLLKMMQNFLTSLFGKGNDGVLTLDKDGLDKFNRDLDHVVEQQRARAKEYALKAKEAGIDGGGNEDYVKAAYLNARADVLEDMNKSLTPENIDGSVMDMSQERFRKEFEDRFNLGNFDKMSSFGGQDLDPVIKEDMKIALASVEMRRMDMTSLQDLDKDIVESRFDYASKRGRLVHAGLAMGDSVVENFKNRAENGLQSPADIAAGYKQKPYLGMENEEDKRKKEEKEQNRDRNKERRDQSIRDLEGN